MPRSRGRKPTLEELNLWREFAGLADHKLVGSNPDGTNLDDDNGCGRMSGISSEPADMDSPKSEVAVDTKQQFNRQDFALELSRFGIGTAAGTGISLRAELREATDGWESSGNIDRKIGRRLRSGRMNPERRIDLHGMDRKQAEAALRRFLHNCRESGVRLVLVVTGKGRGSRTEWYEEEPGILRRLVPAWLQQGPLSMIVQHYSIAHASHGGHGAFYVYLTRVRQR